MASGAMLDQSMILWYARPSATYPTVEVRVADVCPTPADTVLLAALLRGLVATILEGGHGAAPIADHVLEAAHWNAAHSGMDGTLLDPRTGAARPAWDLAADLLTLVTPALRRLGDEASVAGGLERVRAEGTGAARQRRLLAREGDLPAVLTALAVSP